MLTRLVLENFRCFASHEVSFAPLGLLVGRNNAGKSTVVDALRLVSLVAARYQTSNYSDVPPWLDAPKRERGFAPSLRGYPLNLDTVFHNYSEPPAVVTAWFASGASVKIYVGPGSALHGVVADPNGRPLATKAHARALKIPPLAVLPQITPLLKEEPVRERDYILRSMSSNLSSLHFRNELLSNPPLAKVFKALASESWPKLEVRELRIREKDDERILDQYLRDGPFVAEIGAMGHGLQMWLQVMWFLARTPSDASVVLDEPDVYMHPDLQKRLIRLLRGRFAQTIIATHSVEMLSEVEPHQVLVVDKTRERTAEASSLPAVQHIVNTIGSVHNLQLARLWTSQKCLFVEGKDLAFLKVLQNLIFPGSDEPIDSIPNMAVGGWGGWNYAVGSSKFMKNALGRTVKAYCILDRDYHPPSLVEDRLRDAQERKVDLHIWSRKEIENYLLVPAAVARLIRAHGPIENGNPSEEEVRSQLSRIAEDLKEECADKIGEQLYAHMNSKNYQAANEANKKARAIVSEAWAAGGDRRYHIVSGKQVIKRLSKWSQDKYGRALSPIQIARALQRNELDAEIVDVLEAIEKRRSFKPVSDLPTE